MRSLQLFGRDKIKLKIRKRIKEQSSFFRLTVYKSNKHIYTQVFTSDIKRVVLSVSSLDKEFKIRREKACVVSKCFSKVDASRLVGFLLAERIKKKRITQVVFDRSGFKFHGRIKAVADSLIESGIKC